MRNYILITAALLTLIYSGCASFRTDVTDLYKTRTSETSKKRVNIFFDIYHYDQSIGADAIPKLLRHPGINSFNDIFKESLKQLTNIKQYESFTNLSTDVENPNRRKLRDSLISISDYTIKLEILREKSFAKHFIGSLVSFSTLSIIPVGYTWNYNVTVSVIDKDFKQIGKYNRSAGVTTWYQVFLIFIQAFYVEEKMNEDIYLEMISNIFMEIESSNLLR
jgi:hypothetical protein